MTQLRLTPWLTVAALMIAAPLAAQAPVRLRLGTLAPQGTSYHRILQEMADRWRTGTNGQVQTTIYAGTMGSEAEVVRRMRLGQLQVGALTAIGLREIDPTISALQQVPMMFRTLDEAEWVRQRMEPMLAQRLAERGFVVLFWADAGWVRYFSRVPVLRPEDFRRLKIFVTAGDNIQFDLMRAEGYTPVQLEWTDALTALQTGMVDVIPTIPFFALSLQFHTVATHMLEVNWTPLIAATVINKRVWDALSPEAQATLRRSAAQAGTESQASSRLLADSSVAAMQRRGMIVHPVPAAVDAEWRAMSERLYPRIRGDLVPAEAFDEVQRLVREYRAGRR